MALPAKNDVMRAGPRGSSAQEAFVGPFIFEHVVSSAAIATTYVLTIPQRFGTNWRVRDIEAGTLTAISATSAAPVFKIGKTGDDDAFMTALTVAHGTATSTTLSVAKANVGDWSTAAYLIDSDTDLRIGPMQWGSFFPEKNSTCVSLKRTSTGKHWVGGLFSVRSPPVPLIRGDIASLR